MFEHPSSVLPWTASEESVLLKHAQIIHDLRTKIKQGTATKVEQQKYQVAVTAIQQAIEDKQRATEAHDLPVNLQETREQWMRFYVTHGLSSILKNERGTGTVPDTIRLTPAQQEIFKQKYAEGYTRVILVPAGIEKHLDALKKQLADGYEKDAQGEPIPTHLGNPKDSFPNEIRTTDPQRLAKPYLLLTNPNQPLHPNSKNKTADILIAEFAAQGLTGISLADFFIEEREHFEKTGKHLIDWGLNDYSWLLSSQDKASRVLYANWNPSLRQVRVDSISSGYSDSHLGARSSVVLPLDS